MLSSLGIKPLAARETGREGAGLLLLFVLLPDLERERLTPSRRRSKTERGRSMAAPAAPAAAAQSELMTSSCFSSD